MARGLRKARVRMGIELDPPISKSGGFAPAGFSFLTDTNGAYITDFDGADLYEAT